MCLINDFKVLIAINIVVFGSRSTISKLLFGILPTISESDVSATPFRRRPFGDAVSATGRSGDRHFGDGTFRRPPVRRWDVSATGRFGDGRFGDQSSTVFMCSNNMVLNLKCQKNKLFVSLG